MIKIGNKKKESSPPQSQKEINEAIKKLEQKKANAEEQIKNPDIMKMGIKSFMPAIMRLGMGGLLLAGSAMVSGISEPMKPLDIPIPQLPSSMFVPGVPAPIVYNPYENSSRNPYVEKLINNLEKLGNTVLSSGFEGLSESSRKEQSTKNLYKKIREKYDTKIKQFQKTLNKLDAVSRLNTIIAGKTDFQYPEIKNVTSFDDFATKINADLEKPDSDIAKLYTEFSDVHKDLDDDDKKEFFINTLFDNVLDVQFKESFDEIPDVSGRNNKEDQKYIAFKNKFINDNVYKNMVFNDIPPDDIPPENKYLENNTTNLLTKIDDDVKKKFPALKNHELSTFEILSKAMESRDTAKEGNILMRKYMAYTHKQALEKNPDLFNLLKERYENKVSGFRN